MSAENSTDIERLREFLGTQMKAEMDHYEEWVEVYEAQKLSQLQQNTLVEILEFNEEKNQYYVKGYRKKGI